MIDRDDWELDDEREPSEEELAEAEALVRALERDYDADALPDDALEAAHLLRYAAPDALGADRLARVLDEVLEGVPESRPETTSVAAPSRWRSASRWLVGFAATLCAAAVVLVSIQSPGHPAAATLPAPDAALLAAQAAALGDIGTTPGVAAPAGAAAEEEAMTDERDAEGLPVVPSPALARLDLASSGYRRDLLSALARGER